MADESNTATSEIASKYRTRLPALMVTKNDFSVWSILKQSIGKDLSKITFPVFLNEPLSFLQRITEYMECSYLLRTANQCADPVERIQHVAAFAVSALASNWERLGKPFNPLLGETYELTREDIGFRIVCEQVSHHPPVSAFHADSEHFKFYGAIHPKLKFWGKSVEIKPEGTVTVELLGHNEIYYWSNVNCCVHNIIVGKLWFEQYGTMEVTCNNGLRAVLNFKPAGWFGKDLHRVEGFIYNKEKTKLKFLYGKWTDYIKSAEMEAYEEYMKSHAHKFKPPDQASSKGTPSASPAHAPKKMLGKLNSITRQFTSSTSTDIPDDAFDPSQVDNGEVPKSDSTYSLDIPNSVILWRVEPRPDYSPQYYHFTLFSMTLNEMFPELREVLPSTDSRLRPDIRLLEEGKLDAASVEKVRLEEKQREARKARKKQKDNWEPRWFCQQRSPHTKEDEWRYKGEYWERNDFASLPDIF